MPPATQTFWWGGYEKPWGECWFVPWELCALWPCAHATARGFWFWRVKWCAGLTVEVTWPA
jgi:hypothetical protein